MFVAAWNNSEWHHDGNGYGFRVPIEVRKSSFKRDWVSIELLLEGELESFIANVGKKTFWSGNCGEIISRRIGKWIIRQGYARWEKGNPPKFKFEQIGLKKFFFYKKTEFEDIAYWFFRINGCFTINNFVLHPEIRSESRTQRTDADLLAVRFPNRSELELYGNPMIDHPQLVFQKPVLFICEVKKGLCCLNGPWTEPERENMTRLLLAMGILKKDSVKFATHTLYKNYIYEDEDEEFIIRLVAVGGRRNDNLHENVIQFTHSSLLENIYSRFRKYVWEKNHHPQWDKVGSGLYKDANNNDLEEFKKIYG